MRGNTTLLLQAVAERGSRALSGVPYRQDRVTIDVAEFIDELTPRRFALEAANRGCFHFTVHAGDANVAVQATGRSFRAIVTNLLQNAFKFTGPRTGGSLRVIASADRVIIEIED